MMWDVVFSKSWAISTTISPSPILSLRRRRSILDRMKVLMHSSMRVCTTCAQKETGLIVSVVEGDYMMELIEMRPFRSWRVGHGILEWLSHLKLPGPSKVPYMGHDMTP